MIFKTIQSTVYNPNFYAEVPNHSLKKVIWYYAKLAFLIALLGTVISSIVFVPIITKVIKDLQADVLSIYPEGLEIKFEKGMAKSNFTSEPVSIPFSPNWKKYIQGPERVGVEGASNAGSRDMENLMIIDTREGRDPSIESFKSLNTYAFISQKYFIHYDDKNAVIYQSNNTFPQVTVNKVSISKWISYGQYFAYAFPPLCFLLIYIGVFGTLIYIILIAAVFFLIQKLIKRNIKFSESYKICAYASTVPIMLDILFFFGGFRIPFVFTFLTLIIALINTRHHPETETLIQA